MTFFLSTEEGAALEEILKNPPQVPESLRSAVLEQRLPDTTLYIVEETSSLDTYFQVAVVENKMEAYRIAMHHRYRLCEKERENVLRIGRFGLSRETDIEFSVRVRPIRPTHTLQSWLEKNP